MEIPSFQGVAFLNSGMFDFMNLIIVMFLVGLDIESFLF